MNPEFRNSVPDGESVAIASSLSGSKMESPTSVMQSVQDDGISMLEWWQMVWKRRWLILVVVLLTAGASSYYALNLPNIYRAEVLLSPVGGKNGGASSFGGLGGLGGLASMAGVRIGGGGGSVDVNLRVLKSRVFLLAFVKEYKLKQLLFKASWDSDSNSWRANEPSDWAVYRTVSGMVMAASDKNSGLVSIFVTGYSPDFSATLANNLVAYLNLYLRNIELQQVENRLGYLKREVKKVKMAEMRLVLFGLISQEQKKGMLAKTQKEFAFRVLDPAVPPDWRFAPKRSKIVLLWLIIAIFGVVFFVFIWEGIKRQNNTVPIR